MVENSLTERPPRSPRSAPVAGLEVVQAPVNRLLSAFLRQRVADLAALDPALEAVGRQVVELVESGGKRLRPAFVYWGYRAAGNEHSDAAVRPGAAVELLHTFALIHDDVMDRSLQRRGRPAVHSALAAVHEHEGLCGDPRWFGVGGAILAGDLAFVWADELFDDADLPDGRRQRARRVFTDLRIEVMAGQYLDLRLAGLRGAQIDDSLRVALLKSGRYTVTRPLQLGVAIGGGGRALDAALSRFGDAIGVAFQLRDDVLGLFGDPDTTGKGSLEDLREGKRTVLMVLALQAAAPSGRAVLDRLLGDPCVGEADAARAREIVVGCGALAAVERLVAEQQELASEALASIDPPAGDALAELADLAAIRMG
jgi:geranylgeranyl diphosphate synthase type I